MSSVLRYNRTETGIILTEDYCVRIAGVDVVVPIGTPSDGASIPWLLRPILGTKLSPEFIEPAVVHDFYCEEANQKNQWKIRIVGDAYFAYLLQENRVPLWKRSVMFWGVLMWGRLKFGCRLAVRKVRR